MKVFFVITFFLFLQACHFRKNDILPVDTMKVVMWELMQVDEFAGYYIAKDSSKNALLESNKLYNKVFALHKIDGRAFFKSFNWYRNNVDEYKRLVDSLGTYGERKREERFNVPVTKKKAAS